jgi:hypothetical protein
LVPYLNKQLVDRGQVGVFVGYIKATTKQYQLYAPDINTIIIVSIVNFYKDIPRGTIDLKLKKAMPKRLLQQEPQGRPKI